MTRAVFGALEREGSNWNSPGTDITTILVGAVRETARNDLTIAEDLPRLRDRGITDSMGSEAERSLVEGK
jgi:hypothetical protein